METKIQFQKNANVLAANGKQVGQIDRVVLNTESKVVTDIVIRAGTLFNKEDKVVPVELVAETSENQILLRDEAGELESFPPFEERHLVNANEDTDQPPASTPPVIYEYPELGSLLVSAPGEKLVTQIEQNIPEGTVAMKEGAKVISTEGKHVGNVERVLADSSAEQITHLLISKGMFTKERKLIPIKWVMVMGEDEVYLRVKKDSVEEFADASIIR